MPSPPNNRFPEGEPRTGLQPTEPPTNAKPTPRPTSRGTTFPTKMAIAARLLGKEIYRNKLKWFDLRRADYRLGEKVVAAGIPSEHSQFAPQLEQIDKRLASLRQFQHERSDTFGEKVKSWANGIVRMAQIAAGKRRRHRLLKQLGAAVRKNPGADRAIAGELESANLITEKISSVDAANQEFTQRHVPMGTATAPFLIAIDHTNDSRAAVLQSGNTATLREQRKFFVIFVRRSVQNT